MPLGLGCSGSYGGQDLALPDLWIHCGVPESKDRGEIKIMTVSGLRTLLKRFREPALSVYKR